MYEALQVHKRPRVAIFELASCAGCQLQILNLEDELVDVLGLVEFVYFKEAMSNSSDEYDLALIEGSVTRESDAEKCRTVRERATLVGTLGSCAYPVGIPGLKNHGDVEAAAGIVYGEKADLFASHPVLPVDAVIDVDFRVLGCPIDKKDFLETLTALLLGRKPPSPTYPVCVECRIAENSCAFDRGETCLGPFTRAGCGALCPSYGGRCYGCRGPADDPNVLSMQALLEEHGLTPEQIAADFALYNGYERGA